MNETELGMRAAELLSTLLYANLATADDNLPWNTPVTAVPAANLDLYWSSWTEAVHSKNIHANPNIFITYYDSTRARGTNNHRCLYLLCQATVVSAPEEARMAHELIYPAAPISLDDFFGSGLRRFYRARPLRAWLNCLSEQQLQPGTLDMRQEVSLAAIRHAFRAET